MLEDMNAHNVCVLRVHSVTHIVRTHTHTHTLTKHTRTRTHAHMHTCTHTHTHTHTHTQDLALLEDMKLQDERDLKWRGPNGFSHQVSCMIDR